MCSLEFRRRYWIWHLQERRGFITAYKWTWVWRCWTDAVFKRLYGCSHLFLFCCKQLMVQLCAQTYLASGNFTEIWKGTWLSSMSFLFTIHSCCYQDDTCAWRCGWNWYEELERTGRWRLWKKAERNFLYTCKVKYQSGCLNWYFNPLSFVFPFPDSRMAAINTLGLALWKHFKNVSDEISFYSHSFRKKLFAIFTGNHFGLAYILIFEWSHLSSTYWHFWAISWLHSVVTPYQQTEHTSAFLERWICYMHSVHFPHGF